MFGTVNTLVFAISFGTTLYATRLQTERNYRMDKTTPSSLIRFSAFQTTVPFAGAVQRDELTFLGDNFKYLQTCFVVMLSISSSFVIHCKVKKYCIFI